MSQTLARGNRHSGFETNRLPTLDTTNERSEGRGFGKIRRLFSRESLRREPQRLFVPFAALWLLVNVAPWGFGTGYLYSFYLAFTLQKSNVIFPFTYAFAVASFGVVLWAGVRWGHLSVGRTFLIAGTVPFAGPGAFEIVFQETGASAHPALFVGYALPYVMFSYATWVVLGLTGVAWWRPTRRWWAVLAYSVAGFLVWIAIGFPLVTGESFAQAPAAYLLNISLKGSFYLVFFLPILEGMHPARNLPAPPSPDRYDPIGSRDPAEASIQDPVGETPVSTAGSAR